MQKRLLIIKYNQIIKLKIFLKYFVNVKGERGPWPSTTLQRIEVVGGSSRSLCVDIYIYTSNTERKRKKRDIKLAHIGRACLDSKLC
jgi:hypothetical protein